MGGVGRGQRTDKRPDREANQGSDADGPDAEHHRGGVQPHTSVGKAVQQLPENGKRLCLVAESVYPPLQRRRADFPHVRETGQGRKGQSAGYRRQPEHEQPLYRDGYGIGVRIHAAERCGGQGRNGEHAHRSGTEQDPLGVERQAVRFQPEAAPALPEYKILYAERCVE